MKNPLSIFPYNPFLLSTEIIGEEIVIHFKNYSKKYYEVPKEIKWGFFKSNEKCVAYFTKNIKNKFKNEKLKTK